jgi:metal-responsive CopG/Arc/MetJ family transcriptional regulator
MLEPNTMRYNIVDCVMEELVEAKIVQVPMDPVLLAELDFIAKRERRPRSVIIREACKEYLLARRQAELEAAYVKGYRRIPEKPDLAEAQTRLAPHVLPAERW